MIGMGLVELLVKVVISGIFLSTFGFLSFVTVASLFPRGPGPRVLGVCSRLSRQFDLPVGGVRVIVALATLFTGILPGILLYLAAGVTVSWPDGPVEGSFPGFAATDRGPVLLGVCRRLARRLDVPASRVRFLVAVATVFTGVAPGLFFYCLAAFLHTDHARSRLGRFAQSLDELRHDVSWASDRAASMEAAPAGPRRLGRYKIVGELGRGGMGTVYRGRDEALHRDAAVKVIRPLPGEDAGALRRFGEEARAAASLASPHIVQIYEFDPAARPPFLAMELVPGVSVQQMTKRAGALPVATAIDCARQVLAGLATAHTAGIVHRDIKPANILLATTGPAVGTYKLTDFGLARSPDRQQTLTASGSLLGTLTYLAPEVALGDDATPSSDLYSLGATLHEMLAGRPPIAAESPLKLLRKLTTESIPPIGSVRGDLPDDFAAWLDRLVARDPADRFASADRALEALRGVEGFASATTDLDQARPMPGDDAIPWHSRPAPGSPPPLPTGAPPEILPDILGRAIAFEAEGRDALGEDSILDIARELNIDAAAVRGALRDRQRGGGGGITQVFRTALGGKEGQGGAPAGSAADGLRRGRGSDLRRGATLGAVIGAVLLPFLVVKVSREANESAHEAEARSINESAREAFAAIPRGPAEAESGAEALLPSRVPQPTLPAVPPPTFPSTPAEAFHRSVASFPVLSLIVLGCLGLATLWSIGFGVSRAWRALRRRPERNWP